jgi:HPt (histidine-containing phosphotransfer) domain-containing protein
MAGNEVVYIDFDEGVKRVVNNTALYVKLLIKFKADINLEDIGTGLDAGDYEKARVSAHTIKGIAANLSLTELFEKIRDLEFQIQEKALRPGALDTVKTVYAETVKEIDGVIKKYG